MASAILATGCAGQSKDSGEGKEAVASSNTDKPAQAGTTKINIMTVLNTPEIPSDKLEKILEEKTNTDLTFTFVPDGSYGEKLQASLATGSLPQMLYVGNNNSFTSIRASINGNLFWEIGPYLKDYPNLSKLNPDILNNIKINGKIYSLYQETPLTRQGIIYLRIGRISLDCPALNLWMTFILC